MKDKLPICPDCGKYLRKVDFINKGTGIVTIMWVCECQGGISKSVEDFLKK